METVNKLKPAQILRSADTVAKLRFFQQYWTMFLKARLVGWLVG